MKVETGYEDSHPCQRQGSDHSQNKAEEVKDYAHSVIDELPHRNPAFDRSRQRALCGPRQ
ncbi:MAG: hypothetical protein R3C24_13340 [Cyanobacteriota/Melainabacteria group bacterium]